MLESRSESRSRYGAFDPHREMSVSEKPKKAVGVQIKESVRILGRMVDRLFPNYQTPDAMGLSLVKHTPRMLVVSLVLLALCIGGSLLHVGAADFLWGIPALGALGIGFGFLACTSVLKAQPRLSVEVRAAMQGAIRLQWAIMVAGGLTLVYFLGMALRLW